MSTFGILIGVAIGCVIAMVIITVALLRRMLVKRRHARDLRKLLEATLLNPRFCKYLTDNGHLFSPPVTWPLIRSAMLGQFGVDHGEAPDWERINAEYDAGKDGSAYRSGHREPPPAPPGETDATADILERLEELEVAIRDLEASRTDTKAAPSGRRASPVGTIRAMLDELDEWQRVTDAPTSDGVSVPYRVQFIYIGPDGRPMRTTRDELLTSDLEPPPGRYEVHIVDPATGRDLVEPFTAEQADYDETRPGDALGSAMHTALGDLERQIRAQRVRIDDAEKREEKYRQERNTALDQVSALVRERAALTLRVEKAEDALSRFSS